MRIHAHRNARQSQQGTTLAEAMITLVLLIFVIGSILAGHMYGMRLYAVHRSKLEASHTSRSLMNKLVGEVYRAANIYVSSTYAQPFVAITNVGSTRAGNALQIWVDPSNYVCYYYHPATACLLRKDKSDSPAEVIGTDVHNFSNAPVFTLEDFQGNVLTSEAGNFAVGVRLEFQPVSAYSTNRLDYYKFDTRITRRSQYQP